MELPRWSSLGPPSWSGFWASFLLFKFPDSKLAMLPALKHELRIACFCWEVCRWDTTAAEREMPWTQFTRMWCCSELRAWWMKSKIPRCTWHVAHHVARRTRPLSLNIEPTKYIHKNWSAVMLLCLLFGIFQVWRMPRAEFNLLNWWILWQSSGHKKGHAKLTSNLCLCFSFKFRYHVLIWHPGYAYITSALFWTYRSAKALSMSFKIFSSGVSPSPTFLGQVLLRFELKCQNSWRQPMQGWKQWSCLPSKREQLTVIMNLRCVVSELLWHQLRRGEGTN